MIVTAIIAFTIILLMISAMSIGYIIRGQPLHRGCSPLQWVEMESDCDCQQSCQKRDKA